MQRKMKKLIKTEEMNFEELADTLKSGGHPERLAILQLMCTGDDDQMRVKDIYTALRMDQSTTSRHLGIMKKGGLLKREIRNGKIYYGFN